MINVISLSDLIDFTKPGVVNLMIVRAMTDSISDVQQFQRLAPSTELLNYWNSSNKDEEHWAVFKEQFSYELQQPEARIGLQIVLDLAQNSDVNLICYCRDAMHCHRFLVAEELIRLGGEVNLYTR